MKKARAPFITPEFSSLLTQTWGKLPRMERIRKSGVKDFHHTPQAVLAVAAELGAIADALYEDPRLIGAAVDFLKRCAASSEVMSAARAVCLRDMRHWASIGNIAYDNLAFPENIRKIADTLPSAP
jgi:hypothetical protein